MLTRCLLLLGAVMMVPAWASDPIEGYWLVHAEKDHGGVVRLYAEGDCINGKVAALESPNFSAREYPGFAGQALRDINNPDVSKRGQPILGLQIARCLKPVGDGHYEGATFYRPEDGHDYRGKAKFTADNRTLEVRGYLGISLFGQSQVWTRVESPESVTEADYDRARP